ncbi:MAG TPA: hypothetical protein VH796_14075, partial [Nitrososphaeraceae archaeon]
MTIVNHHLLIRTSIIVCTTSLIILSISNINQFAAARLLYDPDTEFASFYGDRPLIRTGNDVKTYQITNPTISKNSCTDLLIASVTSSGASNGN